MSQSSTFKQPQFPAYQAPEFVRFSDNSGSGEKFDGVKVRAYEFVKQPQGCPPSRDFATHWSTANRPEEKQVRLFHERDYLALHRANYELSNAVRTMQALADHNLTVNKAPELSDGQKLLLEKYPHYYKDVRHLAVLDVYRIIDLWGMTNGCQQHSLKKVMLPGQRKKNDLRKDVREARDTLNRWLEMLDEDSAADQATLDFQVSVIAKQNAQGQMLIAGLGNGINHDYSATTYNWADKLPCEAMCGYIYVAPVMQGDGHIRNDAPIMLQAVERAGTTDALYHFKEMEGERKTYTLASDELADIRLHDSKSQFAAPRHTGR